MILAALTSADWLMIIVMLVIIGCAIGGMAKFYHAIQVLKKGKPQIDQELAEQQEQEFQNHEQEN